MLNLIPSKEQLQIPLPPSNLKLFYNVEILQKFLKIIEEIFVSYLEEIGKAWWVKIVTKNPDCIYYFGPFVSHREAQISQLGYIEDLERERPQLITIEIQQCQPKELTIFEEDWGTKVHSNISHDLSA
ncbi:MAG TPA: DUF1816 domain-containing protein [Coleofasciculaceae cyanobacterium]